MTDETAPEFEIPWYEMPHGRDREMAKYDQCEEPADCDHDHDCAIEYMRQDELDELHARIAELEQLRAARTVEDRQIDRVLAMLLIREGGGVEFTAAEMQSAPVHGEFVCYENLLTHGVVLAFQASDTDMSKPDDGGESGWFNPGTGKYMERVEGQKP